MGAEQFLYSNSLPKAIDGTNHLVIMGLLPEYVMIRVLGQQLPIAWQAVERHLELCSVCRSEADMLEGLMTDVYCDSLPSYAAPPAPNLSFLPKNPSWSHPAQANLMPSVAQPGRASPMLIIFSPALLSQSQVYMLARAGDARLRYARTITPAAASDPTITIEVLAPDEHPDVGIIRICVELPDRSPFDQAGSRIELNIGEQTLSGSTDQNGNVVFNDIPLNDMSGWQLTVHPQESAE
jgi:hypothetical protein